MEDFNSSGEGPPHFWGDSWSYWDELYKAESELNAFMRKFRIYYFSTKEKYGSIRYEWLWVRNEKIRSILFLNTLLLNIGYRLVRYKVNQLVKKYPFLKEELLEDFWEFD